MLTTDPNIPDPDDFYDELLKAHDGLDLEQSAALNARLLLILANHVGNPATLREALVLACSEGPADRAADRDEPVEEAVDPAG